MIFTVLVAGSINAAIIPIFSEIFYKKGKESLDRFFNYLFIVLTVSCLLIAGLFFVFTPWITNSVINSEVLQKFLDLSGRITPADYHMFVTLTRLMLLSPILLATSSLVTAYLQIKKEFLTTSLAPIFYNLGMIIGPIIFVVFGNLGVEGIAISAVISSVLHLLVQLPQFAKHFNDGFSLSPSYFKNAFQDIHIWRTFKLAIPRTIGILGEQINGLVNTLISFSLTAGALSAYRFAISLHLFPINIIGSAVAQVALPDLAQHSGDRKKFVKILDSSIQFALYIVFPIVAMMMILRLPIVRLVYGSGAFDWRATILTAWCLVLLGFSIIGQTVAQIVLRAFYALKETWLPLVAIVISIIVNIVLAYYLTNFFSHYYDWRPIFDQMVYQISSANGEGFLVVLKSFVKDFLRWSSDRGTSDMAVGGLALGFGISYFVEMILLMLLLNFKGKIITWKRTIKPILVKILNTVIMAIGMYFVFKLFDFQLDTTRTWSIIVLSAAVCSYGLLSYWIGSKIFRIKEVDKFESRIVVIFSKFFSRGEKDAETV